jgi:nicotinate-nucleotide--dimethylbenzimidazole phosphoribosyltransferase
MLLDLGADVELPDLEAAQRYRDAAAHEAARGELRDIAEWLAGVQGTDRPHAPVRVQVVRVETGDDDVASAIARGAALADDAVDRGTDLLVVAVVREGVAAEAIVSALTGTEPVQVLPRGASLAPTDWMRCAEQVRDLRRKLMPLLDSPDELVATTGDTAIAAATGLVLRATARRTAVLLDGLAAVTAGLVAYQVQGRTSSWWRLADASGHPAERAALDLLGQRPLLSLGTSLADGTAGLLATELIRVAVETARPDQI